MDEAEIKFIGKNPYTLLLRRKEINHIGDKANGRILLNRS
jgi:hypothetical protein